MMKFHRGERRFQTDRLRKKRKGFWGSYPSSYPRQDLTSKQLGKVVQYPASCSCAMCGNVRRIHGLLTRAELRQIASLKEGLQSL